MSLVEIDHKEHFINFLFVAVKEVQMTDKCILILIQNKLLSGWSGI